MRVLFLQLHAGTVNLAVAYVMSIMSCSAYLPSPSDDNRGIWHYAFGLAPALIQLHFSTFSLQSTVITSYSFQQCCTFSAKFPQPSWVHPPRSFIQTNPTTTASLFFIMSDQLQTRIVEAFCTIAASKPGTEFHYLSLLWDCTLQGWYSIHGSPFRAHQTPPIPVTASSSPKFESAPLSHLPPIFQYFGQAPKNPSALFGKGPSVLRRCRCRSSQHLS